MRQEVTVAAHAVDRVAQDEQGPALALVAFVTVEARRHEPLLDLGLFRRPLFVASTGGALMLGISVIGIMVYLPTVLQREVGQSPLLSSASP